MNPELPRIKGTQAELRIYLASHKHSKCYPEFKKALIWLKKKQALIELDDLLLILTET